MKTLLASTAWLIIGFWIGKKWTEHKWKKNATRPEKIVCNGRIYKVHCEPPPKRTGVKARDS